MSLVLAEPSAPSHDADVDVGKLVLDVTGKRVRGGLDARVDSSITDGSLERTIDGASTLTLVLHDPDRVLLRSGMFDYAIDVRLDRLYFRLVKIGKQEDTLTLTFEDRAVAYLRANRGPKKAANKRAKPVKLEAAPRAKVTRAEFALSLVREVRQGGGIPFICPELHVTQTVVGGIANKRQGRTDKSRAVQKQRGLNRKTKLTVKGKQADLGQMRLAERVLDVADSLAAGATAALALMEACIVESLIRNLAGGDADSRGVLQVRDSTAGPMGIDNRDPAQCANAFLRRGFTGKGGAIDLARNNPSWSAGKIAQAVQGSAYGERYDQYQREAQAFLDAYSGDAPGGGTITKAVPYQFSRQRVDGTPEDSWTCLQRLAEEVNWRCFMSAGNLYFISETELLKAKPRLILDEDSPGVLDVSFDVDTGKPVSEVTITARANRWAVAPGAVVQLQNCGPADGRWLVATINRGLFDATATINLRRPSKPLLEPAAETQTVDVGGGSSADNPFGDATVTSKAALTGTRSQPELAYQAALAITGKRYPYVWGGGHARAGVPDHGQGDANIGYDCTGAVCAVLAAAGMGFRIGGPVMASTALMGWGAAGRGQYVTVYTKPGEHTGHGFIVFHTRKGDQHFGTGDWGKGWGGAGLNPQMHPTVGFTARHWPGT